MPNRRVIFNWIEHPGRETQVILCSGTSKVHEDTAFQLVSEEQVGAGQGFPAWAVMEVVSGQWDRVELIGSLRARTPGANLSNAVPEHLNFCYIGEFPQDVQCTLLPSSVQDGCRGFSGGLCFSSVLGIEPGPHTWWASALPPLRYMPTLLSLFWDGVLLSCWGLPQTCDPPSQW